MLDTKKRSCDAMTTSKSNQNLSGEPRKSRQAKNGGGGALAGSNTAAHVISGSDGIVNGVDKVGGASSVAAISGILNGVIGNSNGEVTIEIKTSVMTDCLMP